MKRAHKRWFSGSSSVFFVPASRVKLGYKNTGLGHDFQQIFKDECGQRLSSRHFGGRKKLRSEQCGLLRRSLKRPCNYPLSTGNCDCQASEEERLNKLLISAGNLPRITIATVAMQPYMKLTRTH